MHLISI
jgi:hypothetical protein